MMAPAKAIHFNWLGPELFRLLLGPRGSIDDILLLPVVLFGRPGTRSVTQHIETDSSSMLLQSVRTGFICLP